MKIKIQKLRENSHLPTRGSDQAAGWDLYACPEDYYGCTVYPHQTYKVGTGIAIEIPEGYFGALYPRSGLSTKKGLRPANCVGVIDSDYRGEIIVALHNDSDSEQYYEAGDRIAQLIIQKYENIEFEEVATLGGTDRGTGGFGHTGD